MADMTSSSTTVDKDNIEERPYIDLRIAQQLLDNYKATLARNKQKAAGEEKATTSPATADEPAQRVTAGQQNGDHSDTQQQQQLHTSSNDGHRVSVAEAQKMFNRASLKSTDRTSKDAASLSPSDENPPALPTIDARRQQSVVEDRASAIIREPTYASIKKTRPSIPPPKPSAAAAAESSEPTDSGSTPAATFPHHVEPIYSELVLKDPPSSPVPPSPVAVVAEAAAAHPSAVLSSSSDNAADQLIYEDMGCEPEELPTTAAAAAGATKQIEDDEMETLDAYLESGPQASTNSLAREVLPAAEKSTRKGGYTQLLFPDRRPTSGLDQPVHIHNNAQSTEIPASVASSQQQTVQIVSIASSSAPVTSVVTSVGVVNPIRFLVRPMGSLAMSAADLVPTRSAPAVTEHINTLTRGSGTAIKDAIYMWPTNTDIGLQLSGKNLELVDLEKGTVLSSQPLRAIRLWGTGQGADSRDFAYVSRDPSGPQHLCHVFRCRQGYRAEQISTTLRDVCWKMQSLKERSTASPPGTLSKSPGAGVGNVFHK